MRSRLLLILLALGVAQAAGAAKLYRWVDDEGNVHYSDQIPAEHAKQARDELNEQGITVESVDSAPTPEQVEAARQEARQQAEARKEAEAQARRDRILVNAYTSVEDLKRTRDTEIEALQRTVDMTRAAQDSQRRQLARLVHRAAEMQRAGNPVPGDLVEDMGEVRQRINERANYIEEKRAEQAKVFAEYEQDISRFKELTEDDENQEQSNK